MNLKLIYTTFFTITFLLNTQACKAENIKQESNQTLDLDDALDLAMKNNHHIRSALATLPIAQANLIIAKYRPNPIFNSNGELVKGGSLHPGELWQTFETGRKRYWRVEIAKENISKTELEISKMMWEIHTKVHVGYADLAIGRELYNLASERVDFYESLFNSAEKRFKAGDLSKLELERTRIQLLTVKNELSEFDGKLKKANVEFNHLLGNEVKEEATIKNAETLIPSSKLESYPGISNILDEALLKRLEIAILEKEYGIARAQLKKAKSDRIPNLQLGAGAAMPSYHDNVWGPFYGAQFEIPLFNRKQGEIKQAKAQIDYLEREEERIKHDISIDVINSVKDLEVREEQLQRFQDELLADSEDILKMIKIGYQKGKLSLTDVLNAEQANRDLKQKYFESLYNYQFALASLEYAVGVPLYGLTEKKL